MNFDLLGESVEKVYDSLDGIVEELPSPQREEVVDLLNQLDEFRDLLLEITSTQDGEVELYPEEIDVEKVDLYG